MTRYWAMRTDQARRAFIWAELLDGRLRQGWGYREDQDLVATLPKGCRPRRKRRSLAR